MDVKHRRCSGRSDKAAALRHLHSFPGNCILLILFPRLGLRWQPLPLTASRRNHCRARVLIGVHRETAGRLLLRGGRKPCPARLNAKSPHWSARPRGGNSAFPPGGQRAKRIAMAVVLDSILKGRTKSLLLEFLLPAFVLHTQERSETQAPLHQTDM